MIFNGGIGRFTPQAQAALRIVAALVFMQHGLEKLFHFPAAGHFPGPFVLFSMPGVAGILETFGGLSLVLGLFTRPVAFLLCGEMAVAYWTVHFRVGLALHNGFFPAVNNGDAAVLFCFIFLFIWVAGPGAWSLDGLRVRPKTVALSA